MSVVSYREVVGRTLTHRFGELPSAERRFVCTLDNTATSSTEIANAIGIFHGSEHPEFSFLVMTEAQLSEGSPSPFHAEVVFRYEALEPNELDPNPLARPDSWSFSTSGAAVPAIGYYTDEGELEPLTNAAGEFFETAMTEESEVRAVITGNRPSFPLAIAAYMTNTVNDSEYLNGQPYTWKCAGIGGQQQTEIVNDIAVNYYSITVELQYRASGWPLILPDIGYNYLENGELKRAWVLFRDEDDTEKREPSANKVALAEDGGMLPPGTPPRLLWRRVHRKANFATYFGTPTF